MRFWRRVERRFAEERSGLRREEVDGGSTDGGVLLADGVFRGGGNGPADECGE